MKLKGHDEVSIAKDAQIDGSPNPTDTRIKMKNQMSQRQSIPTITLVDFDDLDAADTLSDEHCLPDLSSHVEYRGVPVVHVEEIPASWSAECQRSGFHVGEIAWFRRPLGVSL